MRLPPGSTKPSPRSLPKASIYPDSSWISVTFTLIRDNPIFFKWKPTGLYWLFALIFLGSQFIGDPPLVKRMMTAVSQDDIELPDASTDQTSVTPAAPVKDAAVKETPTPEEKLTDEKLIKVSNGLLEVEISRRYPCQCYFAGLSVKQVAA